MIDGEICSVPDRVLDAWTKHFTSLSNSHENEFPSLAAVKEQYSHLYASSFGNDDTEMIVDTPFTLEETLGAIKNLKSQKAGGFDQLEAEHLKFGGDAIALWVQQVCNATVQCEVIPDVSKLGIVRPVYKGNHLTLIATEGSHCLQCCRRCWSGPSPDDSVRSAISSPKSAWLRQENFLHGCDIFSSYEVLSRLAKGGSMAYLCLFDLQKAFDTIQYPLLLKCLYDCGISPKHGDCSTPGTHARSVWYRLMDHCLRQLQCSEESYRAQSCHQRSFLW